MPWPKVQRRIAQLIRENRFYTQEEQPAPPDLSGQPITRTGDTITIGNGDASHEVDVTLSDEQWAALQRAVPDSAAISLPYKVGDTVYLDNKPFEITDIGSSDVQLRDPSLAYPIFRAESRENFESLLRRDSRNGSITEFLAADLEHTDADLREALTSGLLEQRDKENIAGYFRENEGNTRVAQRLSETYAGTSDTMELTTGETADFFATTTGFEVDIHDKYNSRRSARWEEIAPILRALYQREQDGFSHEPVLRESANREDTHPSTEVTSPETAQPSGKLRPESGVALPGRNRHRKRTHRTGTARRRKLPHHRRSFGRGRRENQVRIQYCRHPRSESRLKPRAARRRRKNRKLSPGMSVGAASRRRSTRITPHGQRNTPNWSAR